MSTLRRPSQNHGEGDVTLRQLGENMVEVHGVREADHERFTLYWTQAHPAIAGFVSATVPDASAADDVMQEIALTLLRKFEAYDPQRPFIAWAMGIAKMAILTERRDRGRAATRFRRECVEELAADWQTVLPTVDERSTALAECMRLVTGRNRELITMRYEEGMQPQDIATRTGTSSGAIRVALARVRAALSQCIEKRIAKVARA